MENIGAADINLTADDIQKIESCIPEDMIRGERYTEEGMKGVNG